MDGWREGQIDGWMDDLIDRHTRGRETVNLRGHALLIKTHRNAGRNQVTLIFTPAVCLHLMDSQTLIPAEDDVKCVSYCTPASCITQHLKPMVCALWKLQLEVCSNFNIHKNRWFKGKFVLTCVCALTLACERESTTMILLPTHSDQPPPTPATSSKTPAPERGSGRRVQEEKRGIMRARQTDR